MSLEIFTSNFVRKSNENFVKDFFHFLGTSSQVSRSGSGSYLSEEKKLFGGHR